MPDPDPNLSDEDRVRLRRQVRWTLTVVLAPVLVAVVAAWAISRDFLVVITAAFASMAVVMLVVLPVAVVLDRRQRSRNVGGGGEKFRR